MIQQCCNFPTPILWYTILYAQECYIIYSGAQPCNYCWQTTNYIPPSNLTIFPIKKKQLLSCGRQQIQPCVHACFYFNTHAMRYSWFPTPVCCTQKVRTSSGVTRSLRYSSMPRDARGLSCELWFWARASSHPRAETLRSRGFCLALIKIQALQMNIQTLGV